MRILQLDVESIEFKAIKPESSIYEKAGPKTITVKNAIVLFIAVEPGDTKKEARQAINDSAGFAKKQKVKKLVLYPFAHISANLEEPHKALEILQYMQDAASEFGMEVISAPFGWNKSLKLEVKGHPLAEQSRSYGAEAKNVKIERKKIDTSIIKKSDWSGLPENDHRTIGEKLDLYSFQEVSPGMAYWHPNGYIIYKELFRYIREKLDEYGYQEIATPAFANMALWQMSGHAEHFRDNMFVFESEGQEYGLKPMNCPSTIMVFKSRKWSYKELPVRFADFDKLYRSELSGTLSGLFRVRELTQDDAHLFVRDDQVDKELAMVIKMVKELYKKFDLEYKAKLSTMPDDHAGDKETWDMAILKLRQALDTSDIKFEIKEKEGAFYGPKIDFDIKDSMGREWQCATIQLDYNMPKKFKLEYTGEDGRQHTPIIIHRVIYGSLERFLGVLVEHYQGRFPTWFAPVQTRVVSISEESSDYAKQVYKKLKVASVRVELDVSDKTMEYKVRDAQMQKIPYMLIVGKREKESKKISIRTREGKQENSVDLEEFIANIKKEITERR